MSLRLGIDDYTYGKDHFDDFRIVPNHASTRYLHSKVCILSDQIQFNAEFKEGIEHLTFIWHLVTNVVTVVHHMTVADLL